MCGENQKSPPQVSSEGNKDNKDLNKESGVGEEKYQSGTGTGTETGTGNDLNNQSGMMVGEEEEEDVVFLKEEPGVIVAKDVNGIVLIQDDEETRRKSYTELDYLADLKTGYRYRGNDIMRRKVCRSMRRDPLLWLVEENIEDNLDHAKTQYHWIEQVTPYIALRETQFPPAKKIPKRSFITKKKEDPFMGFSRLKIMEAYELVPYMYRSHLKARLDHEEQMEIDGTYYTKYVLEVDDDDNPLPNHDPSCTSGDIHFEYEEENTTGRVKFPETEFPPLPISFE